MISVSEALNIVEQTAQLAASITLNLAEVHGHVLSSDVYSPINFPPFNQSAMDGYAIAENESSTYQQKGIIQAGQDASMITIANGETYRIFTGGMVPNNAWAVVRQEDALVSGNDITFNGFPKELANIRFEAESVKKGELILPKGTLLTPAAVGLLVSLGIQEVSVYAKPCCAIISTGDELVPLGSSLTKGKIYESNAPMLASALKSVGFDDIALFHVKDDSQSTYNLLKEAIEHFDYILISGGVSVGDYDFVAQSLVKIGVQQHFHKVKQKPGKPLFYGTYQNKKIFGLPGNPAAALTLFYIYVLPSIHYSIGKSFKGLRTIQLESVSQLLKPENRAQFLKAIADESKGTVEILEGQSSAMLQTFALANAIVYLDENETIEVGKRVCVYMLD